MQIERLFLVITSSYQRKELSADAATKTHTHLDRDDSKVSFVNRISDPSGRDSSFLNNGTFTYTYFTVYSCGADVE